MTDGHNHHHHHHDDNGPALAELLDLDAEALHTYWDDALEHVGRLAGPAVERIVDLGAGTGTGAIGLARRFPGAEVLAVDATPDMLARLSAKADALGLAGRIRTVPADLDAGWPDLDNIDLTWASMALHHLADPGRTLADLHRATRPGGLVAVAEFDEPLRVLPDDPGVGRPGLEQRCLDAVGHRAALPHLGTDWAAALTATGWTVLDQRTLTIAVPATGSTAAMQYARAWTQRLRAGGEDRLDADDRATLAALLDDGSPHALARRTDVVLRGERTVTVARR